MRIEADWLSAAPTQAVLKLLEDAGHDALAVGGCVRNSLLGAPVADIDIATDARPERVIDLAEQNGLRVIPTGLDHGTVTVMSGGLPHEITTFRRDVDTDGRHATVAFSDNATDDARRRDFTMNALYARADGTIVDPLGGMPDLRAGRVRFIGDPHARIKEDYLRILRFFRFTAWYGRDGLDAEGLSACAREAAGLDRLSRERVGHEIRKLLAAPDPAPCIGAMAQTGILTRVLPGADPTALAPLVHLEGEISPDWLRRLAAIGGDTSGLRLSRAEEKAIESLRETEGPPFALGHILGAERARDALLIRAASIGHAPGPGDFAAAERGADTPFPLVAADLMPALQGPDLGRALAEAKAVWLAASGEIERDDLRARALG
ncbi:CCA tRNA nucleotidyltransferase [Jannaschia aquimarina]|uniref:Cca protein n=1 Tax=Jannaschia aquimarina TaxID=935700 RepID=A0A0D1DAP7_9RHOB|nr:CCA tRNA nucleotidyltransferase [Jannaschia aquimarina]KIT17013.1 CCA-adding enzyme [Jannaschia aquimarina]SNS81473.1 poly(A) polymerase [Jannaschia aquimarina]